MTPETIDGAIYTASHDTIVKHRYNPLLGIVLTVVSAVTLWANGSMDWFGSHEIAAQWNLLISSCVFCTGLTMICYRLFGDSAAPVDRETHERLYRTEFTFDTVDFARIKSAFEVGDFAALRELPRSCSPAVQVICYSTDSGSLAAAQLIRHQQPESGIRIFHEGEFVL